MIKATSGQIMAYEVTRSFTGATNYKSESHREWVLAQVLGVGRDGRVIRYRTLGSSTENKATPAESRLVVKGTVDEAALVHDMDTRVKLHWDANAFKTLDELREYVRTFKVCRETTS